MNRKAVYMTIKRPQRHIYWPVVLIVLTMTAAFVLPKPKIERPDIVSKLTIPSVLAGWQSKDVSMQIELGQYITSRNQVFAREYVGPSERSLLLLILNAENFHHPKVCIGGAGYSALDMDDIQINLPGHTFKANAVYFKKNDDGFLTLYWICIDKKRTDWTKQKFIQLWYSLFNKQKTGLMVRIDVPASSDEIVSSVKIVQEFLALITPQIPPEQADYLFGK